MSPSPAPGNGAEFERKLAVTGPVSLDVSLRTGRVRIRRGDDDSVIVRGVVRVRSFFNWNPERQALDLASDPPVLQDGNHIEIGDLEDRSLLSRVELLLEIFTPADTRVRAFGDSSRPAHRRRPRTGLL